MSTGQVTGIDLSELEAHRRYARFRSALEDLADPSAHTSEPAFLLVRDRIYLELGLFGLVAKSEGDVDEVGGVWHKALRSWALLKRDIDVDRALDWAPGPADTGADVRAAQRWLQLTRPVYLSRGSQLVDSEQALTEVEAVLRGKEYADFEEVAVAAARLAGAVVGTSPSARQRARAFGMVKDLHARLEHSRRKDRLLHQVPCNVDASFYWARANYLDGRLKCARTLLKELFDEMDKTCRHRRHVAAHMLRVRLDRIEGLPTHRRLSSINAARDVLVEAEHVGQPVDNFSWIELLRMEAVAEMPKQPQSAIKALEQADARLGSAPSDRRRNLVESSQTVPRLHMVVGDSDRATVACLQLLRESGLARIADCAQPVGTNEIDWSAALDEVAAIDLTPTGLDAGEGTISPPAAKRALLRVADVIRAQGHIDLSIDWAMQLHEKYGESRSILARLISILLSAGRQPEALAFAHAFAQKDPSISDPSYVGEADESRPLPEVKVNQSKPAWITDVLLVEVGRCFLANGRLDAAEKVYKKLSQSPVGSDSASGYAGLIDVARRRRSLGVARAIAADALPRHAKKAGHLQGEIRVALAWAEIQLGQPQRAIANCRYAIKESPFELAPWLALLRCLRLLGRHLQVIDLGSALIGESAPPGRIKFGEVMVPDLSASHGAVIKSELGWSMLDLDRFDQAMARFDSVLKGSPYLSSASRGAISSRRTLDNASIIAVANEFAERYEKDGAVGALRDINLEAARVLIAKGARSDAQPFIDSVEQDMRDRTPSQDAQVRVLFALADAHLDAGESVLAKPYIRRLERICGDRVDDRVVLLKARVCLTDRDPEGALRELKADENRGESAVLARVICLFEVRRFEDALAALACDGGDEGQSDVRDEIGAWIHLAMSESPRAKPAGSAGAYLELANAAYERLDGSSVSEMHLYAVLQARRYRAGSAVVTGGSNGGEANTSARSTPLSIAPGLATIEYARSFRPDDPSLMRDHASLLLEKGDVQQAKRLLDDAAALDPRDARIQLLSGVAQHRRGDVEQALLHFRRAMSLDSLDYVHYRALAKVHMMRRQFAEAESVVRRGLRSSHPEGVLSLTLLLLEARVRVAESTTNPVVRQRMLRTISADLVKSMKHDAFPSQSPEVRAGYAVLASTVGLYRGRRAEAKAHADALEVTDSRRAILMAHISERGATTFERVVPALLVAFGLLNLLYQFAPFALWLSGWRSPGDYPDSDPVGLGISVVAFVLAAALRRVVGFSWKEIGVELSPAEPVSEIVHTDLDLSSNRLLLISGFSNYRPHIPAEDHEPRIFAMRWGGS